MLSNIARAAFKRTGGLQSSTNRVYSIVWQAKRVQSSSNAANALKTLQSFLSSRRGYATATKTKAPAKKPAAAKKTTTRAASKTVKKPVKKPAKTSVKKATPKSKSKLKTKKPKAKPKAKPKPKRVVKKKLTPEQQERKSIRKLRTTALIKEQPAVGARASAFGAYWAEYINTPGNAKVSLKELQAKFKSLPVAERERFNKISLERSVQQQAAHEKWVRSYTPEQIHDANLARRRLKKLGAKRVPVPIKDARFPKQPATGRAQFVKERWGSGEFKGINFIEANKRISQEWADLPASEKKVYEDTYAQDKTRYAREVKTVLHRDVQVAHKATA